MLNGLVALKTRAYDNLLMIDPAIIRQAWQRAHREASTLDAVLAAQAGDASPDLLTQLGQCFHYPVCRLSGQTDLTPDLAALSLPDCRRMFALVISRQDQHVLLFANPTDAAIQRWADAKNIAINAREMVLESELLDLLARLEAAASALPGILDHGFTEAARKSGVEEISLSRIDETTSPVIRLINSTLFDAMGAGASDIHLEAAASGLVVKYRIDGVIVEAGRVPGAELNEQAISRVKVMAELDITERRTPQDGRFRVRIRERDIDFRVSIMPSVYGEDAVIRILDKEHLSDQLAGLTLNHLGFDAAPMAIIRSLASKPHGMLLITGPTGSGKTTTLYSILSHVNTESVNIMTLEDPVEYPIPLIRQSSVNEAAKLDFASGIRSLMRQDPDIILVGEIRDHPTAEMALRAAMTGHQVYSTLHTNSAIGAIPRLLDIGILPDILAGNIIGVMAQRLIRVLCRHCKYPYQPDAAERKLLGLHHNEEVTLYRAAGCDICHHQGYAGRQAIMEILKMDSDLDDLVARRASIRDIKHAALEKGFRPLAQDGIRRILQGVSSVGEVMRVVDLSDRS